MDPTYLFYTEVIQGLIREGRLRPADRVLVCCGGNQDRECLLAAGLKNVVVSNLDTRMTGTEYSPYEWSFQDAEKLDFPDGTFEFCIEHNGLHHCHSPHRALLEMYRVARKGVVFFEPYDNIVTRVGVWLGVGQDFEHAAVFYNGLKFGGVANTEIPNYIYRWTSAEVEKTVTCYAPYGPHEFRFLHKMRIPWGQLKGRKNPLFRWAVYGAFPFLWLMGKIFSAQSNCFGAVILKPDLPKETYPWLGPDGSGSVKLNEDWLRDRYQSEK